MRKIPPFSREFIEDLTKTFPTPFHLYTEHQMLENARRLISAFSWNSGFKEYFAVKAAPNPFLMKLLSNTGLGMDCSSLAELELSARCGVRGESIMFTSNNTPSYEYKRAIELGAIVNLDDLSQLEFLHKNHGVPELICFRLNPGDHLSGTDIIGKPEEAKFGITLEQLPEAYRRAQELGAKRFGLHTMPISNELEQRYFVTTTRFLLNTALTLQKDLGIECEFINIGGGIGIPYRPEQQAVDIERLSREIEQCYQETLRGSSLKEPKLFMECGRYITGPYGYLITRAIHHKNIYRNYIGVDASMANLMRPGMYGAYHHITVLGKEDHQNNCVYDVVGSLCENNDKFAIQRALPTIDTGDILAIHDTGAHGHAMGFNYNGKLRSAELLLRANGEVVQIRRAETLEDHFSTLSLDTLASF